MYLSHTTGIFTIENSNADQKLSVRIVDISGKTLLQKALNQQNSLIDISKNGKGLYFVLFEVKGQTVAGRIIVK